MKKIIKSLAAMSFIFAFTVMNAVTAQAAHSITAEELLPEDISIVYQFNTEAANPLEDIIAPLITEELMGGNDQIMTEEDLNALINNNIFTFALDTSASANDPVFYVSFYMSRDNFQTILDQTKKDSTIKEVNYNGTTLYVDEYDAAAAFLDGELFLLCNSSEKLKTALDRKSPLAANADYKEVSAKDLAGSFFKMYVNPAFVTKLESEGLSGDLTFYGIGELNMNIMAAMKAESVSVAQTDGGFKLSAAIKGDEQKLKLYNLTFDKYAFTPALFKMVSGKNLILYCEETNLKGKIDDFFNMVLLDQNDIEAIDQFKTDFKNETGIDIDAEIMPLLGHGIMFTVHNGNVPIPGLTLIIETGTGNTNKAASTLIKLVDYLKNELQKIADESSGDKFAYSIATAGGTSFYELAYTFAEGTSYEQMLYLRMAETTDGYLVISTVPNLADVFRKNTNGIMDDSSVSGSLGSLSQELTSVGFFSTDNLQEYLNSLLSYFEKEDSSVSSLKEMVNTILDPWHEIWSKSYGESDFAWGEITANVDTAGFEKYGEVLNGVVEAFETQYLEPVVSPNISFCDVASNSWYYDYVTELAAHNVISGYPDGCFRPDMPITRAEFITLVMKATNKAAAITSGYKPFNDVPSLGQTWYSEYVNMAAMMGFVTGYEDGTFRPDANITRAEAVQILYAMSTKLPAINELDQPLSGMNTFSDAGSSDWFFTAVVAAKHYGLVQGVTPQIFEPNRNITRAEAAKIVRLFLELENS